MFVNTLNIQKTFLSNCCDSDAANSVFKVIRVQGSQIRPSNFVVGPHPCGCAQQDAAIALAKPNILFIMISIFSQMNPIVINTVDMDALVEVLLKFYCEDINSWCHHNFVFDK